MLIPGEKPDLAALTPDTSPVKRRLAARRLNSRPLFRAGTQDL
jgi:hypothetical protein